MSKYNVSTLARKLSEKTGLNQTEAELFIRKMFDVANQGLETDKQLKIRWLGSFKVTSVKDRESVDVNTGERILIEGRDKISFTPDNILKEIVNKPFAQFETVVVADGVEFDDIDRKFDAIPSADELDDEEIAGSDHQQEVLSDTVDEPLMNMNRVSSVLQNVSADLNSDIESNAANLDIPDGDINDSDGDTNDSAVDLHARVESSAASSKVNSGVVDFLGSPSSEETSSQVVVVGEGASLVLEEKLEMHNNPDDLKNTESSEIKESLEDINNFGDVEAQSDIEALNDVEMSSNVEASGDVKNPVETGSSANVENLEMETSDVETDVEVEHPLVQEKNSTSMPLEDVNSVSSNAAADNQKSRLEYLENRNELLEEEEEKIRRHHFVLPKYLVIAAIIIFIVMIGGFGWFAFNYGKIAAQRDHLVMQLDQYHVEKAKVKTSVAHPKAIDADVQEERLREKAYQDSLRMAQASEAVKVAENADKGVAGRADKKEDAGERAVTSSSLEKAKIENAKIEKAKANQVKLDKAKTDMQDDKKTKTVGKYTDDVRVRTGAYRIVGVAQIVKVGAGQTLSGISNRYLGPGMECYVEALNGATSVKTGQSIKIPKLELKRKK